MDAKTQIGIVIISIISMGIFFYCLGYAAGKTHGHRLGRSVGIRIGERRSQERRIRANNG
jgi:hypothetical protein